MSAFPGEADSAASSSAVPGRFVRHFYVAMALLIALVVAVAFAKRAIADLSDPFSPRPWVLHFHIALSAIWVLLFVVQATLIDRNRLAWHRNAGSFGAVIGTLVPIAGIATAIAAARFHITQGGPDRSAAIILPISDMLAFAGTFGLAVWWRGQPEYHRRLMFMATCVLSMAAFPQLPDWLAPVNTKYVADALIVAGVVRDWAMMRRIHPVYRFGLPILVLWQLAARWIYKSSVPAWVAIAHQLVQ